MSEEQPEWLAEQERVDEVVKQVDRRIEALELQTSDTHSEMVDIRKNFWDDVTVNFEDSVEMAETFASLKQQAEVLSERERTHRHAAQQLKTLRKLKSSPYFGRIDFLENGETAADQVYLGIASLRDQADEAYFDLRLAGADRQPVLRLSARTRASSRRRRGTSAASCSSNGSSSSATAISSACSIPA